MRTDELRDELRRRADEVDEGVGAQARTRAVEERVRAGEGRRRAAVAAAVTLAAVAVVGGFVVVPPMGGHRKPGPTVPEVPMVQTPPRLAGWAMPAQVRVRQVGYVYQRGEQTHDNRDLLRVAVPSSPTRQVLAWSTSPHMPGGVVVSVDGEVVHRGAAGALEYGVVLAPGAPHLVGVLVTRRDPVGRIGLAIYEVDPYQ